MTVDLRGFARAWDGGCLIRVPGVCVWAPTCLCHLRIAGVAGGAQKPPDLCGVIGCDACHSIIDRRVGLNQFTVGEIRELVLEALVRTLCVYSKVFTMQERPMGGMKNAD